MGTQSSNERTVVFLNQPEYKAFIKAWGRYSLRGHVGGKGTTDIHVTLYNLTKEDNKWIDAYIGNQKEFELIFKEFSELFD